MDEEPKITLKPVREVPKEFVSINPYDTMNTVQSETASKPIQNTVSSNSDDVIDILISTMENQLEWLRYLKRHS